jgi:hypothetical protein
MTDWWDKQIQRADELAARANPREAYERERHRQVERERAIAAWEREQGARDKV